MTSDDLVLYEITTNDIENSLIIGQYRGYCWGSSCDASNIRSILLIHFMVKFFKIYKKFI